MKTIKQVKNLFNTFNYNHADIWMSRHSSVIFKNESSENNFDNGRALEEIIQYASQCMLTRDPGKNGYDLLALDNTTYECKKVILPKTTNYGKTTFVIKNAHPNSDKPPVVKLADYYILGEYTKRMIMVVAKDRVTVTTSASVKDPTQKTDFKGEYYYDDSDVVWVGDPTVNAVESWQSIKARFRDLLFHADEFATTAIAKMELH
jgi:hypothetical protein